MTAKAAMLGYGRNLRYVECAPVDRALDPALNLVPMLRDDLKRDSFFRVPFSAFCDTVPGTRGLKEEHHFSVYAVLRPLGV